MPFKLLKSELEKAIEYMTRSPEAIARDVDEDETTANIEYMLSRGKSSKIADYNKTRGSGPKIVTKPIPEEEYYKKRRY